MVLLLGSAKPDAIHVGVDTVDALYRGTVRVWIPPANLTALSGTFSLAGNPVGFTVGRALSAGPTTVTLNGSELRLKKALKIETANAGLVLSGMAATLTYTEGTNFPVIRSTAVTQISTNQAIHPVNMPSDIASGDLLVLFAGLASDSNWDVGLWDQATWDAGLSVNPLSGWTEQIDLASGTNGRACIFTKVAAGTEGATQDFALQGGTSRGSWTALRVDTYAGTPEFSVGGENTTDAPNLAASWGSDKNLFLSAIMGAGSRTVSAHPSGYSAINGTHGGNNHSWVSSRALEAASDNPGAYTMSGPTEARAVTVAIRGD